MPAGIRLDLDGAVATVTLDRPDVLNAQTPAMWAALRDVGASLGGRRSSTWLGCPRRSARP
jgi:enoyl-CoA hydratase/carnithine racemase